MLMRAGIGRQLFCVWRPSQAIELGVSCQPEPEEETELTVLCLLITADDVRQARTRFD